VKLVMDRMSEPRERAESRLRNWLTQVNDVALAAIFESAANRDGHGFHMEVSDQIRRSAR
jgi:hypothetical protein